MKRGVGYEAAPKGREGSEKNPEKNFFKQLTKIMVKFFDGEPALAEVMNRKFPVTEITYMVEFAKMRKNF